MAVGNSSFVSPGTGVSTGTLVTVVCLPGYTINGFVSPAVSSMEFTAECNENQEWANAPNCTGNYTGDDTKSLNYYFIK